jgi:hypothetical protein
MSDLGKVRQKTVKAVTIITDRERHSNDKAIVSTAN